MAMTGNQLAAATGELAAVEAKIAAESNEEALGELQLQKSALASAVADQEAERARWQAENRRRRHNYVPFAMRLLVCTR